MKISELQKRIYTPYSTRNTDVAIITSCSGKHYPGIRIENLSFPLTIPAITCSIMICLSEGEIPQKLYLPDPATNLQHIDFWKNEFKLSVEKWEKQFDFKLADINNLSSDINLCLNDLLKQAEVPHSNYPIAAVLDTETGLIGGVNIEIKAWEAGLCAERIALAKALAYGSTGIKALHIHSNRGEYCSPCGACRQVIIEHFPKIPVIFHQADGTISQFNSSDLLPYNFKSDF